MTPAFLDCLIIGAGPAGVAAAYEARRRGIQSEKILILEKNNRIAGTIQDKYPDEKMVLANYKGQLAQCFGNMCIRDMTKTEFLAYLERVLEDSKVQVRFNESVKSIRKLKNSQLQVETNFESYLTSSVFVAVGVLGTPRQLSVPFSREASLKIAYDLQDVSELDRSVLVVGGGDSASEFCQILVERGVSVELSYRGNEFTRMSERNRFLLEDLIKLGKVRIHPASEVSAVEVLGSGVVVRLSTEASVLVDRLVLALGFDAPKSFLSGLNIQMSCEAGDVFCESDHRGVYFIGDLAQKRGGSINLAFNSAFRALESACATELNCELD